MFSDLLVSNCQNLIYVEKGTFEYPYSYKNSNFVTKLSWFVTVRLQFGEDAYLCSQIILLNVKHTLIINYCLDIYPP